MIAGIVLAAGFARRMGRQKLVLSLRGTPIVRLSVEAMAPHVEDLIVVTGQDEAGGREALAGLPLPFAPNPRPPHRQGASTAAGARALQPRARAGLGGLGEQTRGPAGGRP